MEQMISNFISSWFLWFNEDTHLGARDKHVILGADGHTRHLIVMSIETLERFTAL